MSHVTKKLLDLSLPLIPQHGFTLETLAIASTRLPPPDTPAEPYSSSTLNALFPSRPTTPGNRSLSRSELVASAQSGERGAIERLGPARAVLDRWLKEGRELMSAHARRQQKGKQAVREGLHERIRYNEPVLAHLTDGLALLAANGRTLPTPVDIPLLSSIPRMSGYAEHVGKIAHDLALASGDETQGVTWYRTRARLATVYALSELRLLAPETMNDEPKQRIDASIRYADSLLESTNDVGQRIDDVGLFGQWIVRSWAGIAKSWGL